MKTGEINVRDPFVMAHEGKYYLYGTRGATCWGPADGFDVYVGDDLEHWQGPIECFHRPEGFWADRNFWAPEVYPWQGAFYMFPKAPWGTATQFVEKAITKYKLLVIPGNVFSRQDTNFRLSYASSVETIERGIDALRKLAKDPD